MRRILLAAALAVLAAPGAAPAQEAGGAASVAAPEEGLQVHLPRTVEVEGDALDLGSITFIRGDARLRDRASRIPMGRAPWSREAITFDRPTILGRLASHGIRGAEVTLTGADQVVVRRRERFIEGGSILQSAKEYLSSARPEPAGCRWQARDGSVEDVQVPAGGELRLVPRLVEHDVSDEAKVAVAILVDGKEVAAPTVVFRLAYPVRRYVAARDLARGEIVAVENTRIEVVLADHPSAPVAPPYGLRLLQPVPAGAPVTGGIVGSAGPGGAEEVLVKRNENVVMRIEGDGYQITALGQALDDGREGETVRIRNVDSRRIVVARVRSDGSVEPMIERAGP